jgi:hypothetical protein
VISRDLRRGRWENGDCAGSDAALMTMVENGSEHVEVQLVEVLQRERYRRELEIDYLLRGV